MTDIGTIGAALGSLKAAIELAKVLKESSTTLEQAEIKLQLAELISALADAKIEMAEVQDLLLDKDRLIKELEVAQEQKGKMEYDDPYYWLVEKDSKDGPYCQSCYDDKSKLIRLQGNNNGSGVWTCAACGHTYTDSSYHESY